MRRVFSRLVVFTFSVSLCVSPLKAQQTIPYNHSQSFSLSGAASEETPFQPEWLTLPFVYLNNLPHTSVLGSSVSFTNSSAWSGTQNNEEGFQTFVAEHSTVHADFWGVPVLGYGGGETLIWYQGTGTPQPVEGKPARSSSGVGTDQSMIGGPITVVVGAFTGANTQIQYSIESTVTATAVLQKDPAYVGEQTRLAQDLEAQKERWELASCVLSIKICLALKMADPRLQFDFYALLRDLYLLISKGVVNFVDLLSLTAGVIASALKWQAIYHRALANEPPDPNYTEVASYSGFAVDYYARLRTKNCCLAYQI